MPTTQIFSELRGWFKPKKRYTVYCPVHGVVNKGSNPGTATDIARNHEIKAHIEPFQQ